RGIIAVDQTSSQKPRQQRARRRVLSSGLREWSYSLTGRDGGRYREISEARQDEPRELSDWRAAVRDTADRLERDYVDRVTLHAEGFGTWASSTLFGYEIPLRHRGPVGSLLGRHERYARKTGFLGLFGRRVLV